MRPECCCDSAGWFNTKAMQYNPEIGLAFVYAPVTNGLTVRWLLAMRYNDELECHQAWLALQFLTTDLNSRAAIYGPVVRPPARVKHAWSRYGVDHLWTDQVSRRRPPCRSGVWWQLLPARNAVREALHGQHGSQRIPKAEAKQHHVQHDSSIAGSASQRAPSNNELKLTKPARSTMVAGFAA
jgi:hypothetical protein